MPNRSQQREMLQTSNELIQHQMISLRQNDQLVGHCHALTIDVPDLELTPFLSSALSRWKAELGTLCELLFDAQGPTLKVQRGLCNVLGSQPRRLVVINSLLLGPEQDVVESIAEVSSLAGDAIGPVDALLLPSRLIAPLMTAQEEAERTVALLMSNDFFPADRHYWLKPL